MRRSTFVVIREEFELAVEAHLARRFAAIVQIAFAVSLVAFPVSISCAQESVSTSKPTDEQAVVITFDDLTFKMEKDEKYSDKMLTEKIKELDGKTVKLSGFVRPSFKQSGITKFVFVRDNQECCFGPGAALYDCVLVKLEDEEEIDFTVRPISVSGKFFVKPYKGPDGKTWAVFRMNNATKN